MDKRVYTYTFPSSGWGTLSGKVYRSLIPTTKELVKRLDRLDTLRVLTEGYEDGEGLSICKKSVKAFNNTQNFTGIVRLTFLEKEFLAYILDENEYLDDEDKECLRFYIRQN